uniref:Uncharacterized protein n=1 Tax=Steinernema glaseri TaxID=37863 RepID=A0A1I7ZQ53_9BILA
MNGPHERRLLNRNVDVFTLDTDRNPGHPGTQHTREYVHRKQITKVRRSTLNEGLRFLVPLFRYKELLCEQ